MSIKSIANKIIDKLEHLGDVASGYVQIVNTTRAYAEMATPLASGAASFNRSIVPLHVIGLISLAFEPLKMGKSIFEVIKAPKYLKVLPLLKLGTSMGNMLDTTTTLIWILEQLKVSGIQALSAASVPLGGVALGLQALGIAILSWRVHSINKQWKAVEQKLGKKPTMENYKDAVGLFTTPAIQWKAVAQKLEKDLSLDNFKEAVSSVTNQPVDWPAVTEKLGANPTMDKYKEVFLLDIRKPLTKKERYTQKFFGVLTDKQKETIQEIYTKSTKDAVPVQRMEQVFKELKRHHFQQKVQNSLSIALMIIGIVGMTLIAFAPSPIAPIAWGILAGVGTASLLLVSYSIYQNQQFNRALKRTLKRDDLVHKNG